MNTRKIILSGFFIAIGLVLPQLFHILGGLTGPVFLPMHIPVLLAGFICGPINGAIVGLVTVILSHMFTGMPAIPILFIMIIELPTYGFFGGLIAKHSKQNIMLSIVGAMVMGRVIVAILIPVYKYIIGINLPPKLGIMSIIITGLPGILIQLALLPSILAVVKRMGALDEVK